VLLYQCFAITETTLTTQVIVLRETIEDYLKEIFEFICWLHERPEIPSDNLKFELSLM
jgi:hypothetical protein